VTILGILILKSKFLLFQVEICRFIWIYWNYYYFCNAHHWSVWDRPNLRVFLGRIL